MTFYPFQFGTSIIVHSHIFVGGAAVVAVISLCCPTLV